MIILFFFSLFLYFYFIITVENNFTTLYIQCCYEIHYIYVTEKSILLNIAESMDDTLKKMVSILTFSRSGIRINTIRIFIRICKLATAIIAKPNFFNISDSMHISEIKVVSTTTFSRSRIMIKTT